MRRRLAGIGAARQVHRGCLIVPAPARTMHAANTDTKLICVTPVRNEAWVLERFLQCASLWADQIVIADQMSDDGSREIAARFPKVILVDNPSTEYNEGEYHRLLLERARQIPAV